MELTLEQSKKFLDYLIDLGVITAKDQSETIEKISNGSKRCLFLFADFLKRLTPSDCYDVALRMMQKWSDNQKAAFSIFEKKEVNLTNFKKNKIIPSMITEQEVEETIVEFVSENSYIKGQKNNLEGQQNNTLTQNYEVQENEMNYKNEIGQQGQYLSNNKYNANSNEGQSQIYSQLNQNNNHNKGQSQTISQVIENENYKGCQINQKLQDHLQIQTQQRMNLTFLNETLDNIQKSITLKMNKSLKFAFQMLKNHSLKQKLNFSNTFQSRKTISIGGNANTNQNNSMLMSQIKSNHQNSSISNLNLSNNSSYMSNTIINKTNNNNLSSVNNNIILENQSIPTNNHINISNYNINNTSSCLNDESQNKDIPFSFSKNKSQVIPPSIDPAKEIKFNSSSNLNLEKPKQQIGYSQLYKQEESATLSHNNQISLNNNNNNNNNSYSNSFQNSQKSDENKGCTFRPHSTLISPTNTSTIKFNFSAFNSANATPELFNRQQKFQYPEQIMEYSPSSASTVNIQLKSSSFLQSSQQNQQFQDNFMHQDNHNSNKQVNEYQFYEDNDDCQQQELEEKSNFDNEEDEELNHELYNDLSLKEQKEKEQMILNSNKHNFRSNQIAEDKSPIRNEGLNDYKQSIQNVEESQYAQHLTHQNNQVFQQGQYTSNVIPSNNQTLANIHNYSHISKNLDDSTSINFETSTRSYQKPSNAQNQSQKLNLKQQQAQQQQSQQAVGSHMSQFLLQSQDILSTRQIINISRLGEQLGISQYNPFMSEMQYSNIKNQPEMSYENMQSASMFGLINQSNIEKPFIFEDEQDQLLLSQTTENCSIQNKLSSFQSSCQQQQDNQLQHHMTLPNHTIQCTNNEFTKQRKLQNKQDKPSSTTQSNHICVEKHDSLLFTQGDDTNNCQSAQNQQNTNVSIEQDNQIKNKITQNYRGIEYNQKQQQQLEKQIQYEDDKMINLKLNSQSNNEQQVKQDTRDYKQSKEYQQIEQIYNSTNNVALYSFDDDDEGQKDKRDNNLQTNIQINEKEYSYKNNPKQSNQIQQQRNNISLGSLQMAKTSSTQNFNYQFNDDSINTLEQPEQAHFLMISPQQYEKSLVSMASSKQPKPSDEHQDKENKEINNQDKKNKQDYKSKTQNKQANSGLKDLYIDFNMKQDRRQSENSDQSNRKQQLSIKTDQSLQGSRSNNSIHNKLYNLSKLKDQGQQYIEAVKIKQELKDCTFSPSLIARSKSSISSKNQKQKLDQQKERDNITASNNINFTFEGQENKNDSLSLPTSHQTQFEDAKTRKQAELYSQTKALNQPKDSLFQHSLLSKSKESLINKENEGQKQRDSSRSLSVFDKLYQSNQIKLVHQTLNQIEKEENELLQCTFKPQICEQSVRIARSKSPKTQLQNIASISQKSDIQKINQKEKEVSEFAKFYKKNSQQNTQNQQTKSNSLQRNRSSSSHFNQKNLNEQKQNDDNQSNYHSTLPYQNKQIHKNINTKQTQNNEVQSQRKQEPQQKQESDMPLMRTCSAINWQLQKKSNTPILKGCIDPNIDLQLNYSKKAFQDNNYSLQFNHSMPISPINTLSSTFEQIIQKKFKIQSIQDYNTVQAPSNYNNHIKGAQSVRSSKSISFNKNRQIEEQQSVKFHEQQEQKQGSPLIQNCKYFQDDIVDETQIDKIATLISPKIFEI